MVRFGHLRELWYVLGIVVAWKVAPVRRTVGWIGARLLLRQYGLRQGGARRIARTVAVAAAWLGPLLALTAQAQNTGVFGVADRDASDPVAVGFAAPDEFSARTRIATIDLETLARARRAALRARPAEIVLNLFDDVRLTASVDRTAPTFSGGYSISGPIVGHPFASMSLVVNDGVVAGSVRARDGTYRIRSAGDGLISIAVVDRENRASRSDARRPTSPKGDDIAE